MPCQEVISNSPPLPYDSNIAHLFSSVYLMVWRKSVCGRNSIKNHSLALLEINVCLKPGLNTFSSLPRQVYLFKVTVYVYLGGGTKVRICRTTWTDSKWRPVPWCVMVFWFQTWSKHTFVEPKMERKYATEYSTAEKWASESSKFVREDPNTANMKWAFSFLLIGSNSYNEIALRSLWFVVRSHFIRTSTTISINVS